MRYRIMYTLAGVFGQELAFLEPETENANGFESQEEAIKYIETIKETLPKNPNGFHLIIVPVITIRP